MDSRWFLASSGQLINLWEIVRGRDVQLHNGSNKLNHVFLLWPWCQPVVPSVSTQNSVTMDGLVKGTSSRLDGSYVSLARSQVCYNSVGTNCNIDVLQLLKLLPDGPFWLPSRNNPTVSPSCCSPIGEAIYVNNAYKQRQPQGERAQELPLVQFDKGPVVCASEQQSGGEIFRR